ncbi:DEAD/DEAH box helicase [Patescibacteria group bacterium]|nr:DEAD/DEAH box helicase [Patescibacteria group bacterium]
MSQLTDENAINGFYGLGIAPGLLEILARLRYTTPTPIQHHAIPPAMEGKDVVGVAQTGTGKTLAFGIPMLQILAREKGGKGLILLPTRELALQVEEELHKIGRPLGLKTAVLIGGISMRPQLQSIARNPHIIIATPGRLIDHLEQKTVLLDSVKILVLDEADRMLDMGFEPQIRKIFSHLPKSRQTMLFSATIPPEIMAIASRYMKLPVRIEVALSGTTAEKVSQEIFIVRREAKLGLLRSILRQYNGSTLVFTRTKYGAKKVTRAVCDMGHRAAEIHGNRTLVQRRDALDGFKSGKYRVLVATDIASRGIDVRGIELVLNFDLPSKTEDYVHRIGRTGRAGAEGHAISFALPEEHHEIRSIERLIRQTIRVSLPPGASPMDAVPSVIGPYAEAARKRGRGSGPRPSFSRGYHRRPRSRR